MTASAAAADPTLKTVVWTPALDELAQAAYDPKRLATRTHNVLLVRPKRMGKVMNDLPSRRLQ